LGRGSRLSRLPLFDVAFVSSSDLPARRFYAAAAGPDSVFTAPLPFCVMGGIRLSCLLVVVTAAAHLFILGRACGRPRRNDRRAVGTLQRFILTVEGGTFQDIDEIELPQAPAEGEPIETRLGTCLVTRIEPAAEGSQYAGTIVCRLP
jgi:hypothetical protein